MNQVTTVLAGILFSLMFSLVQCAPAVEPTNAVIKKGDSVIISCSSAPVDSYCSNLVWSHFKPGASSGDIICRMAILTKPFDTYISVVSSGDGNCNLKINATSSAAGIYQCNDSSGAASAELTVLEKGPQIAIQTSRDSVLTGLECSVHYSGNLVPKLQWMELSGGNWTQAVADDSETLQNYVSSSILASKLTSQHFKCIATISKHGKEDTAIYNWTSLIFGLKKVKQNKDESEFIYALSNNLFEVKGSSVWNLICQVPDGSCAVQEGLSSSHCEKKATSLGLVLIHLIAFAFWLTVDSE